MALSTREQLRTVHGVKEMDYMKYTTLLFLFCELITLFYVLFRLSFVSFLSVASG